MATDYPGAIDSTKLPNPSAGAATNSPSHSGLHTNENDAIIALETKVGTGSSTPSTGKVFRGTGSGASAWGAADLTTDVTGILPVVNGGSGVSAKTGTGNLVLSSGPTLTTPTIADFTNSTHTHANAAGGGQLNGANAIQSDTITAAQIANRTRWAMFNKTSDGASGVSISQQEANEIKFTGTPTAYGRLDLVVPQDYVSGTNAAVKLIMYSDNTNNQTITYYIGSHASGAAFSSWNIQSSQVTASTINLTANTVSTFTLYTIVSANLAAGTLITSAFRISSAITGSIYITAAYLEYTADS